ncbi:MAG: hypothetical protein AAF671_02760 [Pseudomonadota bacterium]
MGKPSACEEPSAGEEPSVRDELSDGESAPEDEPSTGGGGLVSGAFFLDLKNFMARWSGPE